jgi:transcriptional regulator
MYLPKHFNEKDLNRIELLIKSYPFMTLISLDAETGPSINHLPLIVDSQVKDEIELLGHMSRSNPQWRIFQKNSKAVAIVNGPNTYITPTWYKSGRDVPTWNYAMVHLYGEVTLIEDFHSQVEVLKKITEYFERNEPSPWNFELPSDLNEEALLTQAIVSFKFKVERIEAKFKLSQNRKQEDKNGVIEGLALRSDEMSKAIQALMLENN